jgi:hypothetical protein
MSYDEFLERGAAVRRAGIVPFIRLAADELRPRNTG